MNIPHGAKIEKVISKDRMRQQFTAAYLDLEQPSFPVLVATNGCSLAVIPVTVEKDDVAGYVSVEALKASKTKSNLDAILLNGEEKLMHCTFQRKTADTLGNFPNWRMIDKPVVKAALTVTLNAALLKDLADALGNNKVTLRFEKSGKDEYEKAIDVSGKHGHGKLMPMRGAVKRK